VSGADEDPQIRIAKINRTSTITAAAITGAIGLAGVLVTGFVTYQVAFHNGMVSAGQQATASSAESAAPDKSSAGSPSTPSTSTAARSSTRTTSQVTITGEGLDFDLTPVAPGTNNVEATGTLLSTRVASASDHMFIAPYTRSPNPSEQVCHDWAKSNGASGYAQNVTTGDTLCLVTPKDTTVFLAIKNIDTRSGIQADATVWKR
jgi:cytoskeletal protein RodZ